MRDKMRLIILQTVVAALVIVMTLLVVVFIQNRRLRRKNRVLFERNLSEMQAQRPDKDQSSCPGPSEDEETAGPTKKYQSSSLSDETRLRVRQRIGEIFRDESVFCQEGFSLNDLARLCDSNSRYVSQVINEDMHTTFAQLLNSERVNVARKRLLDTEHYGNMTIEAIIGDLGCKSRSTFSKTFKRITGLSPSEFQRMAKSVHSGIPQN